MDILEEQQIGLSFNPLDVIEGIAAAQPWLCERIDDDELQLHISGAWCDYDLVVNWWPDVGCLHIVCLFDVSVGDEQRAKMLDLLAQINGRLWIGHFDLCLVSDQEGVSKKDSDKDSHIVFRHTHMLADDHITSMQCKALIDASVAAAEKYVLPFQCVARQGRSVRDAMRLAFAPEGGHA